MTRPIALAALLSVSAALAEDVRKIDDRRQLFLDDRFVQAAQGVEFRVHPPRKTGEISIVSEPGAEIGGYNTALYAGGSYHMWYTAANAIAYARSKDGIHWEKPDLRLTSSGVKQPNNIVLGRGAGGVKEGTHGLMVFADPNAPETDKYRLVANPEQFGRMLQVFSSPDGIHWRHTHRDVMIFDNTKKPHHLDTQNVIFWDDRIGKYVAYVRRNIREPGSQGRTMARAESAELGKFGHIDQTRVVIQAGNHNIVHYDPLRKQEVPLIDIYTNGVLKYPWAEDTYFMFPAVYYHYGAHLKEFRNEAPVNAGVLDVRFGASRDGIEWSTYGWRPWVALGMQGEFDDKRIYMGYGVVPAANGREMYMYYLGTSETHGWNRDDRNNRLLTAANLAPRPERRGISRVVLRRDGFVSVSTGAAGGEFTTPPLKFRGDQLVLNVNTSALGEVQVEMLDGQGKPAPGFALADADIIHTANEIDRVVTWNGASSVQKLAGRTVRLRFVLRNADLYAFQFRERPAI